MKKKAIVLSGGGVLSAFQVGVLFQLGIPIDTPEQKTKLFGVSGGALASVAYSYLGPEGAIDMYKSITHRKDIFSYNIFNLISKDALYTSKPLKKLMGRVIRNTKPHHEVSVGVTSLEHGIMVHRDNTGDPEKFIEMAVASASIPGLVQPNMGYVDGAVIDNTPLRAAIREGYTDITILLTDDPTKLPSKANPDKMNIIDVLLRSYELMRMDAFREDLRVCFRKNNEHQYRQVSIEIYALDNPGFNALDFTANTISELIEIGRNAEPI